MPSLKLFFRNVAIAIAITLFGPPALAIQIDHGSYIEDTGTGLDWLKLTETLNISFGDRATIPELSAGWRYATQEEVGSLYQEFGALPANYNIFYDPASASAAESMLNLFGRTYVDVADSWFDYLWGVIEEGASPTAVITPWVGWEDDEPSGIFALNSILTVYAPDYSDPALGHWLVRDAQVPETSAALILGAGLIGLSLIRYRRN